VAIRAFLPLILIIGALVAIGIVFPTLNGPFKVDCGQLDETTCEQIWREVDLHEEGLASFLPVTRVRVGVTEVQGPTTWCGLVYIERWIFSSIRVSDCL
jgi:hypothetical protein